MISWLVVWSNLYDFPYWASTSQLTSCHIFQRGRSTTSQYCLSCFFQFLWKSCVTDTTLIDVVNRCGILLFFLHLKTPRIPNHPNSQWVVIHKPMFIWPPFYKTDPRWEGWWRHLPSKPIGFDWAYHLWIHPHPVRMWFQYNYGDGNLFLPFNRHFTDLWELPTVYKAYFSGLCKGLCKGAM